MKKVLLVLVFAACLASSVTAATIALWTFESPGFPPPGSSNNFTGVLPEVGSGLASGVHANPDNVFSISTGNGSAQSLNANRWTAGDYWQFQISSVGHAGLHLSFAQTANSVGATNFNLSYSLDGASFTPILSFYQVLTQNIAQWNSVTPNLATVTTLDLSAISGLNNAPAVYFRFVNNITSPAANAMGRIDDVMITAAVIPEPSAVLVAGLAALILFSIQRPSSFSPESARRWPAKHPGCALR